MVCPLLSSGIEVKLLAALCRIADKPVSGTWHMKTAMPAELAWPRGEAVGGKLYVFDTDATYEFTPDNDIL